jgi:GT2 family glycosyltransferase
MAARDQLALTRACLGRLRITAEPFVLSVVDTGRSDGARDLLQTSDEPYPLRYDRLGERTSVPCALNHGWQRADTEFVCIVHDDLEVVDPAWLGALLDPLATPGVGLTGLYGARAVRRDGRIVSRTIVHSLAEGPTVKPEGEAVAVIDGVCMCLARSLLGSVGGLDEGYGEHAFDRDLSFAVREAGRACRVVHAPFRHRGGDPGGLAGAARHLGMGVDPRAADVARFAGKWRHRLPADLRPIGERWRTRLRMAGRS